MRHQLEEKPERTGKEKRAQSAKRLLNPANSLDFSKIIARHGNGILCAVMIPMVYACANTATCADLLRTSLPLLKTGSHIVDCSGVTNTTLPR